MGFNKILFSFCLIFSQFSYSGLVKSLIRARNIVVENALIAGSILVHGGLSVEGKISANGGTGIGNVTGPTSSTDNAVARWNGTSGKSLQNSGVLVDDSDNITINGITKDGSTVSWPSTVGAANTFLASDGANNLVYSTPSGAGNVSTDSNFTTDNAILRVDLPSGTRSIQQSGVTVDDDKNLAGVAALRLTNLASNYVGLQAPTSVTNYTASLPGSTPSVNQFLQAGSSTATDLQWTTIASTSTPSSTRAIYVSKVGSDSTGDGSFNKPYASVAKAVDTANSLASSSNPVSINVGSGVYTEDNSGSAIIISAAGISIVGDSVTGTIIQPNTLSNNLFSVTISAVEFDNLTLDAGNSGSTASGIAFSSTATGTFRLESVTILRFSTGLNISSNGTPIVIANNLQSRGNTTAISVSSARLLLKNSVFLGPFSGSTAANTGLTVTGSSSLVTVLSNSFRLMTTAISNAGSASLRVLGTVIESTTNGLVCSGSSITQLVGCNFSVNNSSSINVSASGAGTDVTVEACFLNGRDSSGNPQGVGVKAISSGYAEVLSSHLDFLVTAIAAGQTGDTSSTELILSNSFMHENTSDVTQTGTSTLRITGTSIAESKVTINDSTNVTMTYFDFDASSILTLGNQTNIQQDLMQVDNGFSTLPRFKYFPNFYGHDSLVYDNAVSEGATGVGFGVVGQAANTHVKSFVSSADRTSHAGLVLQSDTGTLGSSADGIRRWTVSRDGSDADLQCNFLNNDTGDGKPAVTEYTAMQVDGFNNNVEFPSSFSDGTQLIWQADTNLYRSAANTLKTDDSFVASGTANINSTLTLATGSITDSSGAISFGNENLSTTGTLGAAATTITGAADTTQLKVIGNSTQTSNILALQTSAAANLLTLSNAGVLSLTGTMTSSGLMTMNVDVASITNDKNLTTKEYVDNVASGLNPIASVRLVENTTNLDLSGNETIDGVATANGNRVLANAQTNAVQNGPWVVNSSGAWTRPSDFSNGSTIVSGTSVFVEEGTTYANSTWVLTDGGGGVVGTDDVAFTIFSSPGAVTASNVGGADGQVFKQKTGNDLEFKTFSGGTHVTITNNASTIGVSTDATSANTASIIVARDASGNFTAGTITATNLAGTLTTAAQANVTSLGTLTGLTMGGAINLATSNITNGGTIGATTFTGDLTGTASGNLALTGGTLTGDLQIPAGTTTNPSLQFTGSTTSGLATVSDTMSFITDATQRMSISSAGTVSIKDTTNGFGSAGVVHNDSSGNLSSSLIVNADVDSSAAIVDSKLATISTAGKVSNSATTATNANTASTIVARDASGNFSAGTITANLTGSVTGAASLNVLKAGDTMSGDLNMGGNNITNVGTFSAATLTGTTSVVGGNITVVTDNISSASTTLNLANSAGAGLRISTAAKILALQPLCMSTVQYITPSAGGTTTINSNTSILIFNLPNTNIAGQTISLPSSPLNGQLLTIVAGSSAGGDNMTAVTFSNGTVIDAPTAFNGTQGRSAQLVYSTDKSAWYVVGRS